MKKLVFFLLLWSYLSVAQSANAFQWPFNNAEQKFSCSESLVTKNASVVSIKTVHSSKDLKKFLMKHPKERITQFENEKTEELDPEIYQGILQVIYDWNQRATSNFDIEVVHKVFTENTPPCQGSVTKKHIERLDIYRSVLFSDPITMTRPYFLITPDLIWINDGYTPTECGRIENWFVFERKEKKWIPTLWYTESHYYPCY